jgi:hypothetical protein
LQRRAVCGRYVGAVVSREVAAQLARLNPRLCVEQIVDAGHGIPYDQPERLATVVRAFLGRRP